MGKMESLYMFYDSAMRTVFFKSKNIESDLFFFQVKKRVEWFFFFHGQQREHFAMNARADSSRVP